MKLENQLVSLELAKKLKDLGVGQTGEFWWDDHSELGMGYIVSFNEADNPICSAFTVAELGEMLPDLVEKDGIEYQMELTQEKKWRTCWCTLGRINENGEGVGYMQRATTEADARAKMLIYLLENNQHTLC